MTAPPRLTNRTALTRHRARAARDPALFLHDEVVAEVQERLSEVNRTFTDVAVVTVGPNPGRFFPVRGWWRMPKHWRWNPVRTTL